MSLDPILLAAIAVPPTSATAITEDAIATAARLRANLRNEVISFPWFVTVSPARAKSYHDAE
jgi:hypothetical protein